MATSDIDALEAAAKQATQGKAANMPINTNFSWLTTEQIASALAEITGTQLSPEQMAALRCICDRLPGATTLAAFMANMQSNADLLKGREHAIRTLTAVLDGARRAVIKMAISRV